MESMFGIETMKKSEVQANMRDSHEQEILRLAWIEHSVQAERTIWYAPLLSRLGKALVTSGNRLQAHYSLSPSHPARR